MPRPRLIILIVVLLAVLGIVLTGVVAARVRARSRSDWFEGKYLTLAPVVKGLKEPTFVAAPPDGSKRLFVLERDGRIKVADGEGNLRPTPFLDLSHDTSTSTEQGMLGLAFHPDFGRNGWVYVARTANDGSLQITRYTADPKADVVDPSTSQTVLALPKQSKYHNGATLAFGPDGYFYISIGDDEASELAQDLSSLFGKILRIDVDSAEPYAVPASNPFVGQAGARGEIWNYGFRNPWRFSFDRALGDMWIGDVGEARAEEVDLQAAGANSANYGWPIFEGTDCLESSQCNTAGLTPPVATYGHDMNCAVVGGYVYRGTTAAGLSGTYLFGDLCTGGVFALAGGREGGWKRVELGFQPIKISSFGEDPAGEVYVVDLQGGAIYRVMDGSVPPTN